MDEEKLLPRKELFINTLGYNKKRVEKSPRGYDDIRNVKLQKKEIDKMYMTIFSIIDHLKWKF